VPIQGTTVTHASLHNEDEIKRLGLKIGGTVIVEKAGDVIPKVMQVLPKLRTGKERAFYMPKSCPICGSSVERKEGEAIIRCTNSKCFAMQLAGLLHFVSAFDMRGLGEKIAEQLIQKGFVHQPSELFSLEAGDFLQLEGFAEISSNKLVKEIQAHREVELGRFINALGIPHVGAQTAEDLARHFGTIQNFLQVKADDLEEIDGVGEVVAESIMTYLQDAHHKQEIKDLLEAVHVKPATKREKTGPLLGTTWVFTGTFSSIAREVAKEKIRNLGGTISESVSKKTSFVVVGEEPGSKYDKAKKLGVGTLSEAQFLRKIHS